jgi:predicted SprT family Zn-dependent metalloprotease
MISLTDLDTANGLAWRVQNEVATGVEPICELRLGITAAGLGTLKITTDAPLDTPTLRRIIEQLVVKVFDADLARKVQVVAEDPALVLALEKSGFERVARQPASGIRFAATKLSVAEAIGLATMARHIDLSVWGFHFDNGKRRAGQCNYTSRVISISKHLVAHHSLDEVQQVVLHEIAHALVGKEAGHGPVFKKQAAALGYRGRNFTGREIAANEASWVGRCKAGHVHYRYRKPTRPLACGLCDKTFSRANQITWVKATSG